MSACIGLCGFGGIIMNQRVWGKGLAAVRKRRISTTLDATGKGKVKRSAGDIPAVARATPAGIPVG